MTILDDHARGNAVPRPRDEDAGLDLEAAPATRPPVSAANDAVCRGINRGSPGRAEINALMRVAATGNRMPAHAEAAGQRSGFNRHARRDRD